MKYRLQNGDSLRFLKIPKKDGTFIKSLPMTFAYLKKQNILLYDDTGFIDKLWVKLRKNKLDSSNIGRKVFLFYTS
jgi:hypothetical protein